MHGPVTIKTEKGICQGDIMVLKNFGVHEFDAPDNYDPVKLRGDHVVKFKVVLPDYDPNSDSKRD